MKNRTSQKNYDFIFDTYQNRDEINQNLSNAPSSSVRINSSDNNFIPIATVTTNYQSNDHSYNVPSNNCFWNPTRELCNLLNEFNNKILFDYPKVPCAYCSILLMQDSIKWLPYDENERYTLVRAFPQIEPTTRINRKSVKQVAVCSSCLKPSSQRMPPVLSMVPPEIERVPIVHRKYLFGLFFGT